MIRSMTGYGRGDNTQQGLTMVVEIRSVNHRFFECSVKSPRCMSFAEDRIKKLLQTEITRGKVDVFINISSDSGSNSAISVNEQYVKDFLDAAKHMSKKFKIKNNITVASFVRMPEAFTVNSIEADEDTLWSMAETATAKALEMFVTARETEGKKLAADVIEKTSNILEKVNEIEKRSPITEKNYREKLESKIKELLATVNIDEQRIMTETAIFADKIAVDEETVRLRSHVAQFVDLVNKGGAIGKKLDFLIQEMNREVNTTGSKAQDLDISYIVVGLKSEIEKIREQIQNIE